MQFHPVVAVLPDHEHAAILDAFMPVFFAQKEQHMSLFYGHGPSVNCKAFFEGCRPLAVKYLDFFHSVITSKLNSVSGGSFVVDNGGIFSSEMNAISTLSELSEEEKAKFEKVVLSVVRYSTEVIEFSDHFESFHIDAIVNYCNNPSVDEKDIARLIRGLIVFDETDDFGVLMYSSDKSYYMRMLLSSVIKALWYIQDFPENKRISFLNAGLNAIAEAEQKRAGREQDPSLSILRNRLERLHEKPPSRPNGESICFLVDKMLALIDDIVSYEKRDVLNPEQFDKLTRACLYFKQVLGDEPVKINGEFTKQLIDFNLSLSYGPSTLDPYKTSMDELIKLLPKIILLAVDNDVIDISERYDALCSLLSNESPFALSGRFEGMVNTISKGTVVPHQLFIDTIDSNYAGKFLANKVGALCDTSPLTYRESMLIFNEAERLYSSLLATQGEHNTADPKLINVTKFLDALVSRQFYQFFLYPALSKNDGLNYDDFAKVFATGLENGVLGRHELRLLPPSSVRQLYQAGGEKMVSIISTRPRLNELVVNLLLMDKIEQLDGVNSPDLLRKASRTL
ncbi:TPA: hypothetical protein RQN23_000814 [Aeromonas veronii]|nr:hypothetical protein [Aeromonas veronii]